MTNRLTNPPSSPQPTDHAGRFQFSLKQLFAAMVAICLVLGAYSWAGYSWTTVFVVILVANTMIAARRISQRQITIVLVNHVTVTLSIVIIAAVLLPALNESRTPARRSICSINVRQIGLALLAYETQYGSFPPAVVYDEQGRPMHSWRVLILPFVDRQDLYDEYRFDEPWHGPNNLKLRLRMPKIFRCPSHATSAADVTSYVAIVGTDTVFPDAGVRTMKNFRDGPSNTLLLVESHNSHICWLEPRDLRLSQMPLVVNSKDKQSISSAHVGGALAAFADGRTSYLSDKLTAKELRAMITPAGKDHQDLPADF